MTIPLWPVVDFVNCRVPEPLGSTLAFEPHAGIDVAGVAAVPAVKQALPVDSQRLGWVAVPANVSENNGAPGEGTISRRRVTGRARNAV